MNLHKAPLLLMSDDRAGRPPLLGAHKDAEQLPDTAVRILVVEDEYFVALTIETALTDAGHEVIGVFASGEAAIEAAEDLRPELVMMDIRLAGEMTGIDAALVLRQRGIPCIFASAHSDAATRDAGGRAQPAGWLVKPFLQADLISAVEAALVRIRSN